MARPRKASDEQVYEAALRIMQRRGPAEWTLAEVAAECGVTAGALVQRFGSKRNLQLELMSMYAAGAAAMYAGRLAASRSPLGAVRAYAHEVACLAGTAEGLAHHLDYLRLDLTDPELHVHFRRASEAARSFLREALAAAVRAGELKRNTDVDALVRRVETTIVGSLFTWATYRDGDAASWMRTDLEATLAPHLARRAPHAARKRSGRGRAVRPAR